MAAKSATPPAWEGAFFEALAREGFINRSAAAAGVTTGAIHGRKKTCPEFAARLAQTIANFTGEAQPGGIPPKPNRWKADFLHALAETSSVKASAKRARIDRRVAYKARRDDEDFARAWHRALIEGYEHLELELLERLRSGEPKDGPKHDNGAALRLLTLHRETMAREHAQRRNLDVASARVLIDQKLEELRQRVLERRKARHADEGGVQA